VSTVDYVRLEFNGTVLNNLLVANVSTGLRDVSLTQENVAERNELPSFRVLLGYLYDEIRIHHRGYSIRHYWQE
jgi:hypothetical protein